MFEFTTEVKLEIVGTNFENQGTGLVNIKWILEIEKDNSGISSFYAYVPDQTVTVEVQRYDEATMKFYKETVILLLEEVVANTTFNHSSKDIKHLTLIPTVLEKCGKDYELKF